MSSGEDVVATIVNDDERDVLIIKNPIVVVPAQNNQLGFAPWSPVINRDVQEISVYRNFIVFMSEVEPGIEEHYNSIFNKVIVPDKKIIV